MTEFVEHLNVLSELRAELLAGFRSFYDHESAVEVRVPTIVGVTGACENVDTLIRATGTRSDRSGEWSMFLSQTGQLVLEQLLATNPACWCLTTSYRDDVSDQRHLREFELVEHEAALLGDDKEGLDELLQTLTAAVCSALGRVDREQLDQRFGLNSLWWPVENVRSFPRITYDEALELLNRSADGAGETSWGSDLRVAEEDRLLHAFELEYGQPVPIFVTSFPAELKFFNMRTSRQDSRLVQSADLLLPVAGESAGAAVREDDVDRLRQRLEASEMLRRLRDVGAGDLEDFQWYLKYVANDSTPLHGGYGIGVERIMQYCTGVSDIRLVSLSHLLQSSPDVPFTVGSTGRDIIADTYAWFDDNIDNGPFAQGMAWLGTPNARIRARRIGYGVCSAEQLITDAARVLKKLHLPSWAGPSAAEEFLTDVLVSAFDSGSYNRE